MILLIRLEISRLTHDNMLSSCIRIAMRALHPSSNLLFLNLNNIEYNLKPERGYTKEEAGVVRDLVEFAIFHFPFIRNSFSRLADCPPEAHMQICFPL